MPSLVPGYQYDIFISYRQKDNLPSPASAEALRTGYGRQGHDGWVSEFVSHLRRELDATFKETVSIYFDQNPHDGLAQHHDVEGSLGEKLRCLVFIPVVSRTYCDPKSFAWKQEFEVFVKQSRDDQFGPKVTLAGGNVASRILPVRIHDLEKEDLDLFESATGSVMRCIDFVYRSPGVNRPLQPHEEHPDDNQNHIIYRDQINKVANAIKEIVGALTSESFNRAEPNSAEHKTRDNFPGQHQPRYAARRQVALFSGLLLSLCVAVYLYYSLTAEKDIKGNGFPGKSIAVLPFENLSGDPEQEYFSDGIAEEILIALAQIKDLKVAGRTSSFQFKGKTLDLQEIGEKLKVNTVLEGTVRRQGNRVRISAKLLSVDDGYQLWSEQFERTVNDVFAIQEEIASAISQRLRVTLLKNESLKIGENLTRNTEAYDAVLRGRFFWNKRELKESEKYFKQAIALDPEFAAAYAGLAETYVVAPFFRTGSPKEALPLAQQAAEKAIALDSSVTTPYFTIALKKANYDWNREEARAFFKKAFAENVNYSPGYYWHAQYLYNFEGDFEKAVSQMRKAVELEPLGTYAYLNLGNGLLYSKRYKEALDAYRFSIQLNNENPLSYLSAGFCNIGLGHWAEAQVDIEMAAAQSNDWAKAMLVYFHLKNGKAAEARRLYDELTAPDRNEYVSQYFLALAASFLERKDLAHEHFKAAFRERDPWLPYIIDHPIALARNMLDDPRNMALMMEHFPWFEESK